MEPTHSSSRQELSLNEAGEPFWVPAGSSYDKLLCTHICACDMYMPEALVPTFSAPFSGGELLGLPRDKYHLVPLKSLDTGVLQLALYVEAMK